MWACLHAGCVCLQASRLLNDYNRLHTISDDFLSRHTNSPGCRPEDCSCRGGRLCQGQRLLLPPGAACGISGQAVCWPTGCCLPIPTYCAQRDGLLEAIKSTAVDEKNAEAREAGLAAVAELCKTVGKPVEPYLVPILDTVLDGLADKVRAYLLPEAELHRRAVAFF